ncbi:hypothetical protein PFISCL1PPCAC_8939, partial [Pristionchus fissidentatus]
RFRLPRSCDSSFKSLTGQVRYFCMVDVERLWEQTNRTVAHFNVTRPVDLNLICDVSHSVNISETLYDRFFPFEKGEIRLNVNLSKTGYVPGEEIIVNAEIRNNS